MNVCFSFAVEVVINFLFIFFSAETADHVPVHDGPKSAPLRRSKYLPTGAVASGAERGAPESVAGLHAVRGGRPILHRKTGGRTEDEAAHYQGKIVPPPPSKLLLSVFSLSKAPFQT